MRPSSDLYVNLGLPSKTLWAKTNLDVTQANGFAVSEFQYECSFVSWGNIEMHNPVSASGFDYVWGSVNAQEPWYEGQPYGETPGCAIQTNIGLSNDVARYVAGKPWRIPSYADFEELLANTDFINAGGEVIGPSVTDKTTTVNGIVGVYLKSRINDERIFFACSGYGSGVSWANVNSKGRYWSTVRIDEKSAQSLAFESSGIDPTHVSDRSVGLCIRPVWTEIL